MSSCVCLTLLYGRIFRCPIFLSFPAHSFAFFLSPSLLPIYSSTSITCVLNELCYLLSRTQSVFYFYLLFLLSTGQNYFVSDYLLFSFYSGLFIFICPFPPPSQTNSLFPLSLSIPPFQIPFLCPLKTSSKPVSSFHPQVSPFFQAFSFSCAFSNLFQLIPW